MKSSVMPGRKKSACTVPEFFQETTNPEGSRQLCIEHWQQNCRRMFSVVIDDLLGNTQLRPGRQWFAAAGIADKARVRAAGDLKANALPLAEVIGGWPDLDRDMQAAIGCGGNAPWCQT